MVTIPLYEYRCHTKGGTLCVPTFKPGDGAPRPLAGHVAAPDGAGLREGAAGQLKLKVPKGPPGEYWLLVADEARAAAASHRYGLRWVPAGATATTAEGVAHA